MRTTPPFSGRKILFKLIDATGLNHLAFNHTESSLRILCYHGAWNVRHPHFGDKLFIGTDTFRQRLELLSSLNCNVLPMEEAVEALRTGNLPPRAVTITIDDGWASTFDFMLPELSRYRFPATIYMQTEKLTSGAPVHDVAVSFALTTTPLRMIKLPDEILHVADVKNDVASDLNPAVPREFERLNEILNQAFDNSPESSRLDLMYQILDLLNISSKEIEHSRLFQLGTPDDVRNAASAGFEIALHTHTHSLGDFSYDKTRAEIESNRSALAAILERPADSFQHFCWPSGEYSEDAADHLSDLGISTATTCDFGLASVKDHPLLLPRILDGEDTSTPELLAQLSGAKSLLPNYPKGN